MLAAFNNRTLLKNKNLIGFSNGTQAVGNQNNGVITLGGEILQGSGDAFFGDPYYFFSGAYYWVARLSVISSFTSIFDESAFQKN